MKARQSAAGVIFSLFLCLSMSHYLIILIDQQRGYTYRCNKCKQELTDPSVQCKTCSTAAPTVAVRKCVLAPSSSVGWSTPAILPGDLRALTRRIEQALLPTVKSHASTGFATRDDTPTLNNRGAVVSCCVSCKTTAALKYCCSVCDHGFCSDVCLGTSVAYIRCLEPGSDSMPRCSHGFPPVDGAAGVSNLQFMISLTRDGFSGQYHTGSSGVLRMWGLRLTHTSYMLSSL